MAKKKTAQPGKLEITQIRSLSGRAEPQRRTIRALGLKRHQTSVIQNDTPQIRGMINQIPHLLKVREINE
jgi:large subunit ribosomal protein L30